MNEILVPTGWLRKVIATRASTPAVARASCVAGDHDSKARMYLKTAAKPSRNSQAPGELRGKTENDSAEPVYRKLEPRRGIRPSSQFLKRCPDAQLPKKCRDESSVCSSPAAHLYSWSSSGSNSAVECDLAKVEVAGSNPVSRSSFLSPAAREGFLFACDWAR